VVSKAGKQGQAVPRRTQVEKLRGRHGGRVEK
jgi:hypothetical protein